VQEKILGKARKEQKQGRKMDWMGGVTQWRHESDQQVQDSMESQQLVVVDHPAYP
jgi:hypothetical protein